MASRGHVRAALQHVGFQRLLAVRLAGQCADGVFQASLAGFILFDPEHQAKASDIAAGFAVLLLPYSLIGPFAGVLLDRWWRQRVLVNANLLRVLGVIGVGTEIAVGLHGEPLYVSALVVVSLNRFVLSALSTALPHVVDADTLVTANAMSTTAGSVATTVGGAVAITLRLPFGDTNGAYAAMAMIATVPYLLAATWARRFEVASLGPDDVERAERETVRVVLQGLRAGARHVLDHRPAFYALTMIGIHRFCYGVTTICTLLLYRNYFHNEGFFRSGLVGLGQVVVTVALGAGAAALVTPAATRRLGLIRWPAMLLVSAAGVLIAFSLPYVLGLMLIAAFALAFIAQGVKICVDTTVQQTVSDEFRGRVFALYDTLFNLAFVGAAVLTALVLPNSGHAPASIVVLACTYAVTGVAYLRLSYQLSSSATARS